MRTIPPNQIVTLTRVKAKPGLNEIHAEVCWASDANSGHRFFHVRHDPVPPAVSEAIEWPVLKAISNGVQKMSGHASFGSSTSVVLEVWSDVVTEVLGYSLDARPVTASPAPNDVADHKRRWLNRFGTVAANELNTDPERRW